MGCTTPKEGTYRLEVEINSNETHGMMGRIKRPLCQCHSTQVDHFSSTHFYSSAPCTYTTATGPGRSRRNQQAALSAGRSPMDHRTIGPSVRPTEQESGNDASAEVKIKNHRATATVRPRRSPTQFMLRLERFHTTIQSSVFLVLRPSSRLETRLVPSGIRGR